MSTTITLTHPVEIPSEGRTITEVTLRRPKVRDLELMFKESGGDIAQSITMAAALSSLPRETVRELDGSDFAKINAAVSDFLAQSAS